MHFTKTQVQVLVVLHLIVAILLTGIFWLPTVANDGYDDNTPSDTTPTSETHDKERLPRIAFSENLYWETNIGGSKTETIDSVFDINNSTYIIGTTNSIDLDFDENKDVLNTSEQETSTFFLKVNQNGSIALTKFFSGSLCFSMLHPSGSFIIIQKTDTSSTLHTIGISGEIGKTINLDLKENETVLDAVLDTSNRLNIIISVTQSMPPLITLKVLTLSYGFDLEGGAVISYPQDLSYINAIPHKKGVIIAANVEGQTSGGMIIFNYNNGTKLLTEHSCLQSDKIYSALNLLPYTNGYAALIIDIFNNAFILTINYDSLVNSSIILLNAPTVKSGTFLTDNTHYYVYLTLSSGESLLKRYDNSLVFIDDIDPFRFFTHLDAFTFYKQDSYFGGRHASTLVLSIITKQDTLFETAFATNNEQITHIIPFDDYILAICHSTATSFDVGKNFGETDIWIAKLRF